MTQTMGASRTTGLTTGGQPLQGHALQAVRLNAIRILTDGFEYVESSGHEQCTPGRRWGN